MKFFGAAARVAMAACFLFGVVWTGRAAGVTLTPAEDTSLREKEPDLTHGSLTTLWGGTSGVLDSSRALLRFDLAAGIPSNATVVSAELTVKVVQVPASPVNSVFAIRKVLRDWSESGATWTNRLSAATPWSVPGAAAPVDYASAATQTNFIVGTGFHTFAANSNLVADVQAWVANPAANFGWILMSESQGTAYTEKKFDSREDPANAPSLTVQYTLPAAPPALTTLAPANGQFRFSFNAESNRAYAVEYIGELTATNWSELTNLAALPAPANVLVTDPLTSSNRCYRVRTP